MIVKTLYQNMLRKNGTFITLRKGERVKIIFNILLIYIIGLRLTQFHKYILHSVHDIYINANLIMLTQMINHRKLLY